MRTLLRVCLLLPLLLCSVSFMTYPAAAQPTDFQDDRDLPDGWKGALIASLVDAVNQNDSAAVAHFMESYVTEDFRTMVPIERHVQVFRSTYRQTGGIDFYSVRSYTPPREQTVVIVRDRIYGGWYSLVLNFEEDEERIAGINFTPARTPSVHGGEPLKEVEFVEEARLAVERGCELDAFSGAVLIARGDDVLFENACGEASKRFGVPNNVDTKFNLGSMNKMFTAVAIIRLVEEGRLDLNDTIDRYVDESWLPQEITERVTIHHLLTHTSGLGSYFTNTFMEASRALYRELDDYRPLVAGDSLAFEPGSDFRYSNTGMFMLGVVIEAVTDQSYFDFIRKNIYEPAGMLHSDSYSMDEPVPNLAMGYIPAPESEFGWRNNLFEHVIKGGPAGGGFSTVRDLHRFARALSNGTFVAEESLATMWTDHSGAGYGYGFGISNGPAGKVVGHSGGFPGLNGNLDIFPESEHVIIVLSNYDRAASPLAEHIKGLMARVATL